MKNIHLNTLKKIIKESSIYVLGIISPIITIIQLILTDFNIALFVTNCILILLCTIAAIVIKRKEKLSLGLVLLAQDGHIHTTRMLILRDNFDTIKRVETISDKNDFKSKDTTFSFHIKKANAGTSDVVYNHSFSFLPLKSGEKIFEPWFFGEDESSPKNCLYKIDNSNWQPTLAKPIIEGCHDYAANEGIYSATIPLGYLNKSDSRSVEFHYERSGSFRWDREEIFVIWPQCFTKMITNANFRVSFDDNANKVVTIIEYVCHGPNPRKCAKANLTPTIKETESIYTINSLKINPDNVYVIYITDPKNQ